MVFGDQHAQGLHLLTPQQREPDQHAACRSSRLLDDADFRPAPPPVRASRSRPTPALRPAGMPTPSSTYLQHQVSFTSSCTTQVCAWAWRGHVGQRLLGDAVGGHLDGRGQVRQSSVRGSTCTRSGSSVGRSAAASWRSAADQPQLVERGRPSRRPGAGSRRWPRGIPRRSSTASSSAAGGSAGCRRRSAPACTFSAGQLRTQAVVQVAAQAPALLLAGGDQPLARALQVGGEPDGVHGHLRLAREVLQQAPVGSGKALSRCSRGEHEPSDLLPW